MCFGKILQVLIFKDLGLALVMNLIKFHKDNDSTKIIKLQENQKVPPPYLRVKFAGIILKL
jgi:hypothetical protein